jgi:hypothetical protein
VADAEVRRPSPESTKMLSLAGHPRNGPYLCGQVASTSFLYSFALTINRKQIDASPVRRLICLSIPKAVG